MNFKTLAITATAAGTILLSGLTFTGTLNLTDIKNFGTDWANKVSSAVENSKNMASKFNVFKSDAETLLNEKIALINDLTTRINNLNDQVSTGSINLEDANNEIARLNEQLEQANNEVEALKNEFASKDTEVQTTYSDMVMAEALDTTLNLDQQAAAPEETPTAPETPDAPETPEETPTEPTGYAAQQTAIHDALIAKYAGLEGLQVTVTATTITLVEPNLKDHDKYGAIYEADIERTISVNVVEYKTINDSTFEYRY